MEMRKQGGEGQGTARSASKGGARKQSGEQAGTTAGTEGMTGAGAPTGTQGATGTQGTPGTSGDTGSTGATRNQGTTGGAQGTSGQQGGGQDLLEHAKHAGGEIMSQVQERAGSQIHRGKETAASQLSQVANAVRRIRENLGGEQSGIARYAADYGDKAADGIERLSHYIREQDPKQLLNDVQSFGRRRPAVLLGGAFLLGFAGARLIKSAMEAGSQQQSSYTNVGSSNYGGMDVSGTTRSTAPNAL